MTSKLYWRLHQEREILRLELEKAKETEKPKLQERIEWLTGQMAKYVPEDG